MYVHVCGKGGCLCNPHVTVEWMQSQKRNSKQVKVHLSDPLGINLILII